jgi:hypothetical protein
MIFFSLISESREHTVGLTTFMADGGDGITGWGCVRFEIEGFEGRFHRKTVNSDPGGHAFLPLKFAFLKKMVPL